MNVRNRSHRVRGLVIASAVGMMLSLGCPSGEPSGGSDGSCSGGSVRMTPKTSGHSCAASELPTITMRGSTLPCPTKSPASKIVVSCSGSSGDYRDCTFDAFDFTGLSLLSPITFEGEFVCGSNSALEARFSPNGIPGKASPDPIPLVEVYFVVP